MYHTYDKNWKLKYFKQPCSRLRDYVMDIKNNMRIIKGYSDNHDRTNASVSKRREDTIISAVFLCLFSKDLLFCCREG